MKITPLLFSSLLMVAVSAPVVAAKDAAKPAEKSAEKADAPKSVQQAVALAKKENKLVFIQMGRKNCGNCRALKSQIASGKYALPADDFIHVDLDCDDPRVAQEFMQRFRVQGATLPFVAISDAKGKPLATSAGFVSKEKFDEMLATALKATTRVKSKSGK